jgi:thermitase
MSGTSLDVYRNSMKWATPNDGSETDAINKKGSGTYTYKVCAAGTTTSCSNTATVVF